MTQRCIKQAPFFTADFGQGVKLEMVELPNGHFTMGAPPGEAGQRENESPQRPVSVSSFFTGKFPITQAQWRADEWEGVGKWRGSGLRGAAGRLLTR